LCSPSARPRQLPHVADNSIIFTWVIGGASAGIIMRELAKVRHSTDEIQVDSHMIELGAKSFGNPDKLADLR
jgi:hypothetical protein